MGQGSLTFRISSAKKGLGNYKKFFKINSETGELTVKKGLAEGDYRLVLKVNAAGDANHKTSKTKTVICKIKVR